MTRLTKTLDQSLFKPGHIPILVKFITHLRIQANLLEAKFLMQPDGGLIGQGDAGITSVNRISLNFLK